MLGTLHFRLVHSSTTTAWLGEDLATSSAVSLCVYPVGLSDRQYIQCGVVVPVVDDATNRACPFTNRQRQRGNNVAAIVTPLTGREEAVNLDHLFAVPGALVLQQAHKLAHRGITECLGQAVVADHPAHVQILDANHVEAAYQGSGDFLHVVEAGIRDAGVAAGDLYPLTLAAVTAFLFAGQGFLLLCQFAELLLEQPRVDDMLSVREGGEPVDTHVNPDGVASFWQRLDGRVEHQSHEVPAVTVLGYRHSGWGTGEWARPADIQAAELGNGQVAVGGVPVEGAGGVLRRLRAMLAFEGRIRCAPLEEVNEGCLQVAQCLLRGHGRYFVEPRGFWLLLQLGQGRRRRFIIHPRTIVVSISTSAQGPVIHKTARAKGTREDAPLVSSGVQAKLVAHLHRNHGKSVSSESQPPRMERHFLRQLKQAVSVPRNQ